MIHPFPKLPKQKPAPVKEEPRKEPDPVNFWGIFTAIALFFLLVGAVKALF
jgi:hypothetical protein